MMIQELSDSVKIGIDTSQLSAKAEQTVKCKVLEDIFHV